MRLRGFAYKYFACHLNNTEHLTSNILNGGMFKNVRMLAGDNKICMDKKNNHICNVVTDGNSRFACTEAGTFTLCKAQGCARVLHVRDEKHALAYVYVMYGKEAYSLMKMIFFGGRAFLSAPLCTHTTDVQVPAFVGPFLFFSFPTSPPTTRYFSSPSHVSSLRCERLISSNIFSRVTQNCSLTPSSTTHSVTKCATVSSTAPHRDQSTAPPTKPCLHFSLRVFVLHWNRIFAPSLLQYISSSPIPNAPPFPLPSIHCQTHLLPTHSPQV